MCSPILMVDGLFTFIDRWQFSWITFIWQFENNSNVLAEQLSRELTIYSGVASDIKGIFS